MSPELRVSLAAFVVIGLMLLVGFLDYRRICRRDRAGQR